MSETDKLFRYGRTLGFPMTLCVAILRVLSSPMMKTGDNSLWSNHSWSFDSLNLPLSFHLQKHIQGIPVACFARLTDTFLWPHNKGTCSVKFASKFLFHQHQVPWNKAMWNWLWTLPCPKKIHVFLWKAMRNRLPTKTFLSFGRQHMDSLCLRCHSLTTIHIL